MSKRPTDHLEPAAKKRGSERQLTKDDASDEDEIVEKGSIQTASDDILKTRKIVKVARRGTAAPPSTPASGVPTTSANPFAGVSLLGSASTPPIPTPTPAKEAQESVKPAEGSTSVTTQQVQANVPKSDAEEAVQRSASVEAQDTTKQPPTAPDPIKPKATAESSPASDAVQQKQTDSPILGTTVIQSTTQTNGVEPQNSFASFASNNAPFASAGANKPLFNFSTLANGSGSEDQGDGKAKPFSFGPLTSSSTFAFQPIGGAFPSVPVFGSATTTSTEEGASEDGAQPDNIKPALAVLPPETETVTGEEDESQLWAGEGTLYEFTPPQSWKERGKGEMRVNKGSGRPARFVLRQRGHHRLLMNANLWPDMKVTKMDGGKGATFPVVNAAKAGEGESEEAHEPKLQTFAFRVKTAAQMDAFIDTVNAHKTASNC